MRRQFLNHSKSISNQISLSFSLEQADTEFKVIADNIEKINKKIKSISGEISESSSSSESDE